MFNSMALPALPAAEARAADKKVAGEAASLLPKAALHKYDVQCCKAAGAMAASNYIKKPRTLLAEQSRTKRGAILRL